MQLARLLAQLLAPLRQPLRLPRPPLAAAAAAAVAQVCAGRWFRSACVCIPGAFDFQLLLQSHPRAGPLADLLILVVFCATCAGGGGGGGGSGGGAGAGGAGAPWLRWLLLLLIAIATYMWVNDVRPVPEIKAKLAGSAPQQGAAKR